MDDDLLTIGALARRAGLPVRTVRYWSDIGAVPVAGRTPGGYRLYDARSVGRLDLVRTLRDLGLGLTEIRRVLAGETTVAAVAAVHVRALDTQIRVLRLRRAVLRAVAGRKSDPKEMTLMNKLARLSADERRQIIDDFVNEVFDGLDADPALRERMRGVTPELPDDPTPEQVDAWVELAELVRDPSFRRVAHRIAEHNARGRAERADPPGAYLWFAKRVTWLVNQAAERGVAPDSPAAVPVLDELFPGGLDAARRAAVLDRLRAGSDPRVARYWQLLRIINGEPPQPDQSPAFEWVRKALQARG